MDNYPDTTWAGDPAAPWNRVEEEEPLAIVPEELDELDTLFIMKAVIAKAKERADELERSVKLNAMKARERLGLSKYERRSAQLGDDVGYLGFQRRKGKPSEHVVKVDVVDAQKVTDWMETDNPDTYGFAMANLEEFARWCVTELGLDVPGVAVMAYDTEATPDTYIPVLKVNADAVIEVMDRNGLTPRLLEE